MNTDRKSKMEDTKVRLSTLWVFVMFNMLSADVLSFMLSGFAEEAGEMQVTQGFMLVAAILMEIPIAMIVLSRVLAYRVNRWANIVAAVITIVFVICGGSTTLHYLFIGTVEVLCMLLIIWLSWKWPKQDRTLP